MNDEHQQPATPRVEEDTHDATPERYMSVGEPGPEEHWADDLDELPPRPRRRLITPVTGALLALFVAAAGFVAGALVEKGQADSSSGGVTRRSAGFGARAGGGGLGLGGTPGGGTRAGGAGATVGQVTTLQGGTLYVNTLQGNTVEVRIPAGERISQTISTGVKAIHPGDTVVVQGSPGSDGSITAISVRASAATVTGAGGGSAQLFGGGGSTGASSGGGGSSLFGGG